MNYSKTPLVLVMMLMSVGEGYGSDANAKHPSANYNTGMLHGVFCGNLKKNFNELKGAYNICHNALQKLRSESNTQKCQISQQTTNDVDQALSTTIVSPMHPEDGSSEEVKKLKELLDAAKKEITELQTQLNQKEITTLTSHNTVDVNKKSSQHSWTWDSFHKYVVPLKCPDKQEKKDDLKNQLLSFIGTSLASIKCSEPSCPDFRSNDRNNAIMTQAKEACQQKMKEVAADNHNGILYKGAMVAFNEAKDVNADYIWTEYALKKYKHCYILASLAVLPADKKLNDNDEKFYEAMLTVDETVKSTQFNKLGKRTPKDKQPVVKKLNAISEDTHEYHHSETVKVKLPISNCRAGDLETERDIFDPQLRQPIPLK